MTNQYRAANHTESAELSTGDLKIPTDNWIIAGFLSFTVLAALLARPYKGLIHDASLYSLQALARLNPDYYSNDLFFKFGSQDNYTLFTPIYAGVIGLLGLENGAAFLFLIFQACFFASSVFLARQIIAPRLAWLAGSLVILVPYYYGGLSTFQVVEQFITVRPIAECLIIAALALRLKKLTLFSYALTGLAFLIHPLMATGGLLILLAMDHLQTLKRLIACTVLAGLGTGIVWVISTFFPIASLRIIDVDWLYIIQQRSAHLFVYEWQTRDWLSALASLCTLILFILLNPQSKLRQLAITSIFVSLIGIGLSIWSSFTEPVEIILQGQPWRWTWVSIFLTLIVLPWTVINLWHEKTLGKAAAIILTISVIQNASLGIGAAVALVLWIIRHRLNDTKSRLLLWGASSIALILLIADLANIINLLSLNFYTGKYPTTIEAAFNLANSDWIVIILVFLVWFFGIIRNQRIFLILTFLFSTSILAVIMPALWHAWTNDQVSGLGNLRKQLAPWREAIPVGSNVLWIDNPAAVWLALKRPNYISRWQLAGVVFFRDSAIEGARRAAMVKPLAGNYILSKQAKHSDIKNLTQDILTAICKDPELGFVVGPPGAGNGIPYPGDDIFAPYTMLYDCNSVR